MSIAYLDPGNIESDLQAGSLAQYQVCRAVKRAGGGGGRESWREGGRRGRRELHPDMQARAS